MTRTFRSALGAFFVRAAVALVLALGLPVAAQAQSFWTTPGGSVVSGGVGLCLNAQGLAVPCSSSTPMYVVGSFSASLGGFVPAATVSAARLTQFTVNTTDTASANWPSAATAGAVLVVDNSGSTNPMYCNVDGSAATTSDKQIPANSWFAFTIPASPPAALHCIATGGTSTAEGTAGTGLPTGAGGGGGGGGSVPTGSAGSPNAAVLTVQGVGSMTPLYANATQWGSATLGAATAFGTAPTGNVPGVNGAMFYYNGTIQTAVTGGAYGPYWDASNSSNIIAAINGATPPGGNQMGSVAGIGVASLATAQATVTTTATLIAAARTGVPGTGRKSITIINKTGTDSLCIGNTSSVTTSTGECLPAIAGASLTLDYTGAVYGIVATTTQTVTEAETY